MAVEIAALSLFNGFATIHGGGALVTDGPRGGTRVTVTLAHAETESPEASADLSIHAGG